MVFSDTCLTFMNARDLSPLTSNPPQTTMDPPPFYLLGMRFHFFHHCVSLTVICMCNERASKCHQTTLLAPPLLFLIQILTKFSNSVKCLPHKFRLTVSFRVPNRHLSVQIPSSQTFMQSLHAEVPRGLPEWFLGFQKSKLMHNTLRSQSLQSAPKPLWTSATYIQKTLIYWSLEDWQSPRDKTEIFV